MIVAVTVLPKKRILHKSPVSMSLLASLETAELIDLLATNTQRLSELLAQKNLREEYEQRKKLIIGLQHEIHRRKNSATRPPGSIS